MAEPRWPRHAVRVGVFEFRRSVRAIRRDRARLALLGLSALFPSAVLLGFLLLLAGAIRGAGEVALPAQVRGTVALLWLFGVFVAGQRVASARPRVDNEALLLTTVSSRTAAVGYLLAETLRALAYVGPAATGLTAGFVFVFRSPAPLTTIPLAVVALTATAVVAGAAAGYAVAWLVATSRFVARHKTLLGGLVVVFAMGGYALVLLAGAGLPGQRAIAWLPVGWLADLAVLGTPIRGSPARAAGALAAGAAVLVAGGAAVERETAALWFDDPVSPDDAGESGAGSTRTVPTDRDPLAAAIRPIGFPARVPAPTRRVAEWTILRSVRDPRRLSFLLMPVLVVGSTLISAGVASGTIRSLAPPVLAVALPWLAGALVGMNPLGEEGAVLPVTLLSVSGRRYVRGLLLPAAVYGVPVAVLATALAGAVSPYTPAQVVALVAVAGLLVVIAAALAPAVGVLLPRFSAIRVGQSRDVLPPRIVAVALHLLLVVVPGGALVALVVVPLAVRAVLAGVTGLLLGPPADAIRAAPLPAIQIVAGWVLLAGGVAAAVAAYRFAVGRFDRYEPA